MPIESPINDLSSLNENWPLDSDQQSTADDHVRLSKDAAKKQFTDIAANGGVVTVTAAEMNALDGITGNVQTQLNAAAGGWRFADQEFENPAASEKLLVSPPTDGMTITLPNAPTEGSEIQVMDALGQAGGGENTFGVKRSGSDSITDIDLGLTGLIAVGSTRNGQYMYCVYSAGVWYVWSIR